MPLRTLLIVGLGLALALLTALGAMTLGATRALVATQEEVRRTDEVMRAAAAVRGAMDAVQDAAETAGPPSDEVAADPYVRARGRLLADLTSLEEAALLERDLGREVRLLRRSLESGLEGLDGAREQQRVLGGTEGFDPLMRVRTVAMVNAAGLRLAAIDQGARALLQDRSANLDAAARESAVSSGFLVVVGAAFYMLLVGLLIHHMTRLKRSQEETAALNRDLAERQGALERANRELDAFTYSVSHDLKAPLRTIDGFAQIVQEDYGERLDDEGRRLLGVVRSEVRRLSTLLEGLLALSRTERAEIPSESVDLAEVVRVAVERARAAEPGRVVDVTVDPLPRVRGDPTLLPQVFVNLVGNAFKYTRARERAEIRISSRPEGNGHEITVADNGIGFSAEEGTRLFGVFTRLTQDPRYEGVGVGLTIVDRIVRRHGGRVRAEGEPGRGAKFTVWLPDAGNPASGGG